MIDPILFAKISKDCVIGFTAKVYSDSLPEPLVLQAELKVTTEARKLTLDELVPTSKLSDGIEAQQADE
ncbi:MAG: hypothetical protein WD065_09620 [Planctomycetaceae bacterium]